jgi:antitoxin CptB
MKELDVMLSRYLDDYYPTAPESERATFHVLLELADPLLYAYFLGNQTPEDEQIAALIRKIRGFFEL